MLIEVASEYNHLRDERRWIEAVYAGDDRIVHHTQRGGSTAARRCHPGSAALPPKFGAASQ